MSTSVPTRDWNERELTICTSHGYDFALEGAVEDVPCSLIDDEGCEGVIASVLVGLRYDPGRSVGNSEVEDFALLDQLMQAPHNLFDARLVVPPVDIEEINVIGAKFLQRSFNRDMEGSNAVSNEEGPMFDSRVTAGKVA